MTDIPTTENYDFPVMSDLDEGDLEEETVDEWGDIIDNGADREETDGLIEPLDAILDGIQSDADAAQSDADAAQSDVDDLEGEFNDHADDSSAHHDPVDGSTMIDVDGQTVSHADTSSQSDVSSADGEAITSIDVDSRGHVQDIGTNEVGGMSIEMYDDEDDLPDDPGEPSLAFVIDAGGAPDYYGSYEDEDENEWVWGPLGLATEIIDLTTTSGVSEAFSEPETAAKAYADDDIHEVWTTSSLAEAHWQQWELDPNDPSRDDDFDDIFPEEDPEGRVTAAHIYDDGSSGDGFWRIELDLSDYHTLKMHTDPQSTSSNRHARVRIDGDNVMEDHSEGWDEQEIDISGYNGTHHLRCGGGSNDSNGDARGVYWNIRLE